MWLLRMRDNYGRNIMLDQITFMLGPAKPRFFFHVVDSIDKKSSNRFDCSVG